MTQLQVGKTYKNLNPHAGKTFNNLAGRSVYIPKQFTVLKDKRWIKTIIQKYYRSI